MRSFWDEHARRDAHVAIYDSPAVRDAALRDEAFASAGRRDARLLWPFLGPENTVLDLGCGMGRVIRELAPWAGKVIGLDVSREMLDRASEYLGGLANVELLLGDGQSLQPIPDGSVDFLYSLLCLIHVDKRSAWSYLREAARVLRPGALSFLQFQNILSAPGWAKFEGVARSDYPLEFYAPDEVAQFARSAGFDLLTMELEAEYVYATLIKGSAEDYLRRFAADVRLEHVSADGMFVAEAVAGRAGGGASGGAWGTTARRIAGVSCPVSCRAGWRAGRPMSHGPPTQALSCRQEPK